MDAEEEFIPLKKSFRKKFHYPVKSEEEKKAEKEKRKQKRARIIVRNISYKVKEDELKKYFSQYGTINDFNLLKRSDGKLVGCAFVQYDKVTDAAKVIAKCSGKPIFDREVFIDWAVDKNTFNKFGKTTNVTQCNLENKNEIKTEEEAEIKDEIKSETDSDSEDSGSEQKIKIDVKNEIKTERKSNDLIEGCTVFIKNIPFNATNKDFGDCCKRFGSIYYALINKDNVSGHSKGTGFVKFKSKDSADMCLKAGTEFKLFDNILESCTALSAHDIKTKQMETKNKQISDSRNLYLTKEGVILADSPSAEGVSASDMAKRLQLEKIKGQMLKNLNRFISKERLQIHNVPMAYDNAKLRKIIEHHTKLKFKECRIMRENKPSVGQPLGKSKGFAFVSFKTHNDALQCLRKLNNNPAVFGQNNRPIVSFSIEDKVAHNIKQKRLQKSKEKNPTFQKNIILSKNKSNKEKVLQSNKKPTKTNVFKLKNNNQQNAKTLKISNFSGVTAEPGVISSVRPNWKINEQAAIHNKSIKIVKRNLKKQKEQMIINQEKKEVDRTKKRKRGNDVDNFSFLLDKYKKSLENVNVKVKKSKKSKWYVE